MDIGDAKAALARAYAASEQPQLAAVLPTGRDEIWTLGGVAFILPIVPSDASPELEYALRLRRDASLVGECENCRASFGIHKAHTSEVALGTIEGIIPHRGNCPAADENVAPLLDAHYEALDAATWSETITAASKRTKEKIDAENTRSILIPETPGTTEWAKEVLDKHLELQKRCMHLRTRPAQTWNVLLDDGSFKCDECWAYFEAEIASGRFQLGLIEEFTCDRCRRYSNSLQSLVLRISNFVLRGGLCQRCTKEIQVSNQ